jgi:CO/xanthine dehydrogenase Mo-binding subunit
VPLDLTTASRPAARIDGREKVTGAARYASDFAVVNPAYAFLVTSAIARGRISSVDLSEANAVRGILTILTHENAANEIKKVEFFADGGPASETIVPLAGPEVWHDGQIIAIVVATTFEAAREAAYRTRFAYVAAKDVAEVPYIYALECAIDELAVALRMDPIELRRVNDTKVEPIKGLPYTSRSLMPCFDATAKEFGWSERRPEPMSMRDGDWLIGNGCAMATYPSHMAPASAELKVILVPEEDDRVNPAGIKGVGELGNVGTAAAIANAVFHATGKRIRQLPIRLEKLLDA